MGACKVILSPSGTRTRILVTDGPDELLRAVLPPPSQMHYERAAIKLLEGLSQWLNAKLYVVLSVDEKEAAWCLGLTDHLGAGLRSVYFDVEVRDRRFRRRRGQRIRGIGDFKDLHPLRLIPDDGN